MLRFVVFASLCLFCFAKNPNILFILADDLGYGEVEVYPANSTVGRISTPYLTQLAAEGLTFTESYSGEAVCAPSRCTLLTGKHTGHSTIRGNAHLNSTSQDFPLKRSDVTVAKVLKDAGYRTGAIGKWGLGNVGSTGLPYDHGFDYYYGQLSQTHCHDYYPTIMWEYKGTLENRTIPENVNASRTRCMENGNTCVHTHDKFMEKALDFIRESIEEDAETPFFLYLAFTLPHAGGWLDDDVEIGQPIPTDGEYTEEDWPDVEKDHAASVTYEDASVGAIMRFLKEHNIDDDTVVFFASDNGPHDEGGHDYTFFNSAGPLHGYKRSLYEGGIRTPMIVRWPGKVAPNTKSSYYMAFWDFLPTAAEIAGVSKSRLPSGIDGSSVLDTILGKEQPPKEYLYWEYCAKPPHSYRHTTNSHSGNHTETRSFSERDIQGGSKTWGVAVRMGKWKGVRFLVGADWELYNLEDDIGERNDVSSEHKDIVEQIEAIATREHTDDPHWPIANCGNPPKSVMEGAELW